MNETEERPETSLIERAQDTFAISRHDPRALALRLQDMKKNRELTREFFKDVLEEGVDYGLIPGTDKPTLFKAGAESLCELYGYAPTYQIAETTDLDTGFLRCVVTCTLVQRGTGEVVAQGIGECNTREAKYFYRWMSESALKKLPDLWSIKDMLKKENRSGKNSKTGQAWSATYYRVENDDLFTLWNTVLKMAKKRAHVDGTLSATRSSGLFSKGKEGLEDFIEAEYSEAEPESVAPSEAQPAPPSVAQTADAKAAIWALLAELKSTFPADEYALVEGRIKTEWGTKVTPENGGPMLAYLESCRMQSTAEPAMEAGALPLSL